MAITYQAGRRLQGLSTDVNPTYETDFSSSTGWTQSGSTTSIGSGIASLLPTSGNNDRVYTPISFNTNGKFVIDYDFIINSESKSDSSSMGIVGTSNSSDGSLTDDAIVWGIQFASSSPTVSLFGKNFSGGSEDSTAGGTIQLLTSTTYYARIIRDQTSNIMYLYTSSANRDSGTSADSVSITMTSAVTNDMTQLVLGGRTTGSGSCDTDLDNISLDSGVIVANSGKPTNVQAGSRFEETDTRKMYHYNAPATAPTTTANFPTGNNGTGSVNARIDIPTTNMSMSNGSVAFWAYRPSGTTADNQYVGFSASDDSQASSEFFIGYYGNSDNVIVFSRGTTALNLRAGSIPTSVWSHIVYTNDYDTNTGNKVYVNGIQVTPSYTSGSSSSSVFTSNVSFNKCTIGGNKDSGNYEWGFEGNLQQLLVYSAVLTQAEITALYNNGKYSDPSTTNLLRRYELTSNANDTSGNGHNGTATAGVTYTSLAIPEGSNTWTEEGT